MPAHNATCVDAANASACCSRRRSASSSSLAWSCADVGDFDSSTPARLPRSALPTTEVAALPADADGAALLPPLLVPPGPAVVNASRADSCFSSCSHHQNKFSEG